MIGHETFFEPNEFPWVGELEASADVIKQEMMQLTSADYNSWPRKDMVNKDWNDHPLILPGVKLDPEAVGCPNTRRIVKKIPGLKMATFSKLLPRGEILPHYGYSKAVLRGHLALKVPVGATVENCAIKILETARTWKEGKMLIFNDMPEHQAYNRLDDERIILIIDFLRPWKYRTSALGC
ncbi:MAG: aspartyl/asparaginyl beta-hydroxylase domain-containing protein [Planctomycetes bacterium]|nr:aspartyl/asparaginyl beta-hydroxylase domain-containing protein [Planctomycetota bacterium]